MLKSLSLVLVLAVAICNCSYNVDFLMPNVAPKIVSSMND